MNESKPDLELMELIAGRDEEQMLETVQKSVHKAVPEGDVKTSVEIVVVEVGSSDSVGWRSARNGSDQKQPKTQKQQMPQDEPSTMVKPLGRRLSRPDKKDRKARYWKLTNLGLAAAVIVLGLYSYMLNSTVGVIYFTFEPKDYDTVAITLEPDANGVKPRGTIVLAGGLKS